MSVTVRLRICLGSVAFALKPHMKPTLPDVKSRSPQKTHTSAVHGNTDWSVSGWAQAGYWHHHGPWARGYFEQRLGWADSSYSRYLAAWVALWEGWGFYISFGRGWGSTLTRRWRGWGSTLTRRWRCSFLSPPHGQCSAICTEDRSFYRRRWLKLSRYS